MIPVRPQDVMHKAWLLRLLTAIADNPRLSTNLYFKGGTCASMLGFLDRFSVDLDFDLKSGSDNSMLRQEFHRAFDDLELHIDDESKKALEFFLKYPSRPGDRNTIKLDALPVLFSQNCYEAKHLPEIDRVLMCQTADTMFAHKLVAPVDRYEKHGSIAGRDLYDIHHFFFSGLRYRSEVIVERTGMEVASYLTKLVAFIEQHITETVINQDLNTLLTADKFQQIRHILKTETLQFLHQEIDRLGGS